METSVALLILALSLTLAVSAQTAPSQVLTASGNQQNTSNVPSNAPLTLTLQDALQRAKKNNPEYRTAVTEFGLAKEDRVQSRAALLPSVNYNGAFIYTEGNGTAGARFIANNGVHEYISQGNVHQEFSLANIADYRRSAAAEAVARARSEITARGLVVTVVQAYYGLVVAQRKYSTEQQAATEAERFFDISQKLGVQASDSVVASGAYGLPDNTRIKAEEQQKDPSDKGSGGAEK